MFTLLAGLWLISSSQILKAELLQIDHMSVESWRTMTRRDPFQPELTGHWTRGAQFNLDLRMFCYFSWKNKIHMDGTSAQLRNAGWEFDLSFDRFQFQPFYYHHSQHALDGRGADDPKRGNDYPLIDRYGVRFVFYQR